MILKNIEKSYKNIFICYIEYVTIKKDLNIHSVNPLYLIFGNVNGYFEEINGKKYLILVPTNESKEKIKDHWKLWTKIKDLIRSITKNLDDYDEKYMKSKFDSDNNLPLDKTIESSIVTIGIKAVFLENNKYCPQFF